MEDVARFRNKITWFIWMFGVLVVWVHSANGELFLGEKGAGARVIVFQRVISNTIGQIAVPGFFMISGYLFYRDFSWENLKRKWNSRIRSILMPFLVWNGIYYAGYVIGSRLPWITDIVEKGRIPLNWDTAAEALFHYSYNYVFWYLYQLILLVALAPAIYGILNNQWLGIAALIVLFFLAGRGIILPCLNLDALFYYSTAAFGAIHGAKVVEGNSTKEKRWMGAAFLAAAVAVPLAWDAPEYGRDAAFWISRWPERTQMKIWFRLMACAGLWFLADETKLPAAGERMQYHFFLYAIHFALIRFINKTLAKFLGGFWPIPVFLFLAMPALMLWISFEAGSRLRRRCPRLWFLLNGGR